MAIYGSMPIFSGTLVPPFNASNAGWIVRRSVRMRATHSSIDSP